MRFVCVSWSRCCVFVWVVWVGVFVWGWVGLYVCVWVWVCVCVLCGVCGVLCGGVCWCVCVCVWVWVWVCVRCLLLAWRGALVVGGSGVLACSCYGVFVCSVSQLLRVVRGVWGAVFCWLVLEVRYELLVVVGVSSMSVQ